MDTARIKHLLNTRAEELFNLAESLDENGTKRLNPDEKALIRQCAVDDIKENLEIELAIWSLNGKMPELDMYLLEVLS